MDLNSYLTRLNQIKIENDATKKEKKLHKNELVLKMNHKRSLSEFNVRYQSSDELSSMNYNCLKSLVSKPAPGSQFADKVDSMAIRVTMDVHELPSIGDIEMMEHLSKGIVQMRSIKHENKIELIMYLEQEDILPPYLVNIKRDQLFSLKVGLGCNHNDLFKDQKSILSNVVEQGLELESKIEISNETKKAVL